MPLWHAYIEVFCLDDIVKIENKKIKFFGLVGLSTILLVALTLSTHSDIASAQNNTLMQPQGTQGMSTNASNIVLVHGGWLPLLYS